jgi:hypothetical protein
VIPPGVRPARGADWLAMFSGTSVNSATVQRLVERLGRHCLLFHEQPPGGGLPGGYLDGVARLREVDVGAAKRRATGGAGWG